MTNMHPNLNKSRNENIRRLFLAFVITFIFVIIEIIGGLTSASLALLADAGHILVDAVALLLALLAARFSCLSPSAHHTFGWIRLTTLTAFTNAITLVAMTIFIVWESVQRFFHPQLVAVRTMMTISIIGLVSNLVVFWILHNGIKEKNFNVRAASLLVMGDIFSSIGAVIAALIIFCFNWILVDPILSLLMSCLILRSTWTLLKESTNELLEGAPMSLDISTLKHNLYCSIPEVYDVHHVHVWQIGEKPIMTLHVQVIPSYNHDMLLARIQHFLENQYEILHSTIQIEYQSYCRSINHTNEL